MTTPPQDGSPAADGYADPHNPATLRYWDGMPGTEHTTPATAPVPGTPGGGSAPASGGSHKVLRIVLGVGGGVILVVAILAVVAIPAFLNQRQKAADTLAKVDVSTLGGEIATWYVDHEGPAPSVESRGGDYFVDGIKVATVSSDVELGTVTGTGGNDWCVCVTNPKGDLKSFEYSAETGLKSGTC